MLPLASLSFLLEVLVQLDLDFTTAPETVLVGFETVGLSIIGALTLHTDTPELVLGLDCALDLAVKVSNDLVHVVDDENHEADKTKPCKVVKRGVATSILVVDNNRCAGVLGCVCGTPLC